ncbi:MAG TPA: PEP-CTERM sorting domain-containing protein [Caulobacteraceae bacterium]|jgi:hypothetical protein|nr:PEP-CTERM sorting domain-containing protein [Caulobacteraceae bacterium]
MRGIFKGLLAAAAVAALAGAPARANTTIPLIDGGGWSTFDFLGAGSTFQDLDGNTIDFTFTLTSKNIVRITDGFQGGDQFEIFINNADAGPTSASIPGFVYAGDCWSCAYFDPAYSTGFTRGSFDLGPGTYDIEGFVIQSPYGAGQGAIELGAVPEPASWVMMLLGFIGLGALLRRTRRTVAAIA